MKSGGENTAWFEVANPGEVYSPGVVIYFERMQENLRRMIQVAGGPGRLRPHMKTHKLPEVLKLHLDAGIRAFKCATLAEAEMCARVGAPDLLLAYPLVGPNVGRFIQLCLKYRSTRIAAVVDDEEGAMELSRAASAAGMVVDVYVDVDCGQHRTGIEPGPAASQLYRKLGELSGLRRAGLHVYDGHVHASNLEERRLECEKAWGPVVSWVGDLERAGMKVEELIAGGTPSFPFHAAHAERVCSPGTCIFWDQGYANLFPDMDFLPAALLLTRVVSRPVGNRLTLDLGYKAVASESPQPRVKFLNLPGGEVVGHNEEHLIYETGGAAGVPRGYVVYAVPKHVCPTIALHDRVAVVKEGRVVEFWKVEGRTRMISV